MLYRHIKRFQAILRDALLRRTEGSLATIVAAANMPCSKSSLDRFHNAADISRFLKPTDEALDVIENLEGLFLNYASAKALWDYLVPLNMIGAAMTAHNLDKSDLYSEREIANAILSFYAINKELPDELKPDRLKGKFVCYKPSIRRKGYILKSLIEIKPTRDGYFEFNERQKVNMTRTITHEESTSGFGIVNNNQLWIFGRETKNGLPRIFSFHKFFVGYTGYYGNVLEGTKTGDKPCYDFRVVMISQELDKKLWHDYNDNKPYSEDDQCDAHPLKAESTTYIPPELIEYIKYIPKDNVYPF